MALKQIEGSHGVAEAVALCRPEVICAYPISPQTHIVEGLGEMVKAGDLNAEFINVESEFAAMSVAIGRTAFYTGGYFCEVLRAALKSVPRGQSSAALSLGMTYWQTQRHIVVPQLFGFLIPPTTSLVIMMFKDSAIFSVMSLPEMTYQSNLLTANTFAYLEVLGTTALLYWVCSVLMAGAGRRLETLVRRKARQA